MATHIGRWSVLSAVSAQPSKRSMSNNFNFNEVAEHPGSPVLRATDREPASEEGEDNKRRRMPRVRYANPRRSSSAAPGRNRANDSAKSVPAQRDLRRANEIDGDHDVSDGSALQRAMSIGRRPPKTGPRCRLS